MAARAEVALQATGAAPVVVWVVWGEAWAAASAADPAAYRTVEISPMPIVDRREAAKIAATRNARLLPRPEALHRQIAVLTYQRNLFQPYTASFAAAPQA